MYRHVLPFGHGTEEAGRKELINLFIYSFSEGKRKERGKELIFHETYYALNSNYADAKEKTR